MDYKRRLDDLERELRELLLDSRYEEADRVSREISELKKLIFRQAEEFRKSLDYQVDECTGASAGFSHTQNSEEIDQLKIRIAERDAEITKIKILMATLFAERATSKEITDVEMQSPKEEGVVYQERLTFAESYALLNKTLKGYCDSLRDYAVKRSGEKEIPAKYHLTIGKGNNVVVKLMIKSGTVIALFRLEDERLRQIKRGAVSDDVEIKIKETEIQLTDSSAVKAAKEMIELRLAQIDENKELQKQRAAERRKASKNISGTKPKQD
ncbi:MAG: hypothetical protein NC548_36035 [Lachnospiraceae bacterium]|nr:hypothetical protein [Lachnospiraceae bacterium]